MHMADALLSPQVGGAFVVASGATLSYSARKLAAEADETKAPMMGVLGAFVFAAQMINFTIPGTGSSGHLVGGILLLVLLGPYAAFITLASILVVQALFFGDGGLLALGTNIWNMGFYTCFGGYLILRLAGVVNKNSKALLSLVLVLASVAAFELGAFSVVIETVLSGRSELPVFEFSLLMAGIHLPIGLVEGFITVAVINLVYRARPELLEHGPLSGLSGLAPRLSLYPALVAFFITAVLVGGVVSWFASQSPDGLEWSLEKSQVREKPHPTESTVAGRLQDIQEKTSFLPDYGFKSPPQGQATEEGASESWPDVSGGTSLSGVLGSIMVLCLVVILGLAALMLRRWSKSG